MKLYSWGANSHGQLGQGILSEACCTPEEVKIVDPSSIFSIVGGGGHTLILERSGQVYGAGWNNRGQLAVSGEGISTFHLIESLSNHKILQLACGWDSSVAVISNDALVAWGSNSFSQLGTSKDKFSWTKDPKTVPISRVKQASLGLRHLAVVGLDGKVLVCGSGSKGQLGILDANGRPVSEVTTLTLVPEVDNVLQVACGQHHTVALTRTGQVFAWGDNKFGQLGLDPAIQPVLHVPQEVAIFALGFVGEAISVFCGWTHTVLLTDKGEMINWGRNAYGQLGTNLEDKAICWKPAAVQCCDYVQQFEIGSEHNLALVDHGKILSWGWNEHGNCGTGTQDNAYKPQQVSLPEKSKALLIGSGACHSFAVLDI